MVLDVLPAATKTVAKGLFLSLAITLWTFIVFLWDLFLHYRLFTALLQKPKLLDGFTYVDSMCLNVRLVSSNLLNLATPSDILAMYNPVIVTVPKTTRHRSQITYSLTSKGFVFESILEGSIPYYVKTFLASYLSVAADQFDLTTSHTVHNILRYVTNYLMSSNLQRMANKMLHSDKDSY
jgi:hypothetical protein